MRGTCWISKATRAQAYARASTNAREHARTYVVLIAFLHQQWFRARASLLRYTYIVLLLLPVIPQSECEGFTSGKESTFPHNLIVCPPILC